MLSTVGLLLLLVGFLGALLMLYLGLKSLHRVHTVTCKNCGGTTEIPHRPGEYLCQHCGTPLAKITPNNKASQ